MQEDLIKQENKDNQSIRQISQEQERLLSLIEFSQHSARLKLSTITDVSKHAVFHKFEHEIISLPGVSLNSSQEEDEIWISVKRLLESNAPPPENVCSYQIMHCEPNEDQITLCQQEKTILFEKRENNEWIIHFVDKESQYSAKKIEEKKHTDFLSKLKIETDNFTNTITSNNRNQVKEIATSFGSKTSRNSLLAIWLDVSKSTETKPTLKKSVERIELEKLQQIIGDDICADIDITQQIVMLSEYKYRDPLEKLLSDYIKNQWSIWADEEKKRRHTIKLYAELFTIKQQLEGSIVDTQIELVCGLGIGIWKTKEFNIRYPLITQLVEIFLNEKDMTIEIRPQRATDSRFELDVYMSVDNLGVADLEKAYAELMSQQVNDFSPFDVMSYEKQLQLAATHLDPKGIYCPNQIMLEDRQLPNVDENLKVTDTWVLFARPRSKSLFIQDLENFKKQLSNDQIVEIPSVVTEIINPPSEEHSELKLPQFRGLSNLTYTDSNDACDVSELFFPLPFNEEQVSIVQKLECSKGVVVQGPPGTGKTHTITNIIAHYMANGKRVLVTSMKEPALSVLKEKLPKSIQPLAISLLTNEQDGMKQFEFAISKIAQELQCINRSTLENEIKSAEQYIDQLHAKLAWIDRSINDWAKNNIQQIQMDEELIHPEDAAREIRQFWDEFEWLDDKISISDANKPNFDNTDIIHLREARSHLKDDLCYLEKKIIAIDATPKLNNVLYIHNELLKSTNLKAKIESEKIPTITNIADHLVEIETLLNALQELISINKKMEITTESWTGSLKSLLKNTDSERVIGLFEKLFNEINDLSTEKNIFLEKPVSMPNDLNLNNEVTQAIFNKSQGKSAFGISGAITKRSLTKKIDEIRILTSLPKTTEEWEHIHRHVLLSNKLNELIFRWNNIADETSILSLIKTDENSNAAIRFAKKEIESFLLIKKYCELELAISKNPIISFFHNPDNLHELFENDANLKELVRFVEINLNQHRSADVSQKKETMLNTLSHYDGHISEQIKKFIERSIGNSEFTEIDIKNQWASLVDELGRIHGLKPHLDDVESISNLIMESGSINWAKKLKTQPMDSIVDSLLPDNWAQAWRLRRLATHLQTASHFDEFKKLTSQRGELEKQLAKTYQDVVANRTWLKLANNATPDIRAALQAYLSAIIKIGKGTGKRAIRYRRDAKNAASRTNKAIPCWIMPHHRISESLPTEFGSFDLVIIDEASQSDLSALPAILRAKKLLVVGDDKQVSPEGVGLEEEKINNLMARFLSNQVDIYRQAMSPERSIYDLCKIVFSDSQIMLREHFRCVPAIIEYSKREFYNHELKPLRLPTKSERLDPPLIDVLVEDGFRDNKENAGEARFIVDEIIKICDDLAMENKTIGVVSLLGSEQARKIWDMLQNEITPEKLTKHKITCGDALTFQGKERDIMFLSMVVTRESNKADSREASAQRFNVAASRARDRMYLVRSVELGDLSPLDKLRRQLIEHFTSPFAQDEAVVKNLRDLCESSFETEMYDLLTERGYRVIPQVKVGSFRIDMVVEGHNDARLAIECDGDRYHDASRWEADMNRQRILERTGWKFWRCFASTFTMNRKNIIQDLINSLTEHSVEPIGKDGVVNSIHSERRKVRVFVQPTTDNENAAENI
ncbi:MAG: hypothetical protein COY58_03815 [Gammaproteobacteria bacterium CG_4_10_14_0_8_um_filter_38_16]|nr:MAG: hypothetical protein COY58_03815 [Gammaproteobacteria bacterium CG_4_10_14_0_8_um_filter_38_16]PJA03188.1 MAG: hypothetical protein COX72_06340 [Gammaproteobacteria bacterium CG_4_10_14_0_2_um_filter_38_22]PJB10521.1 MAG: hypothetical protein CO120_04475 [Gammaproteobacteria bacterium CG_4_9_14_3_um_filter_38_9]